MQIRTSLFYNVVMPIPPPAADEEKGACLILFILPMITLWLDNGGDDPTCVGTLHWLEKCRYLLRTQLHKQSLRLKLPYF